MISNETLTKLAGIACSFPDVIIKNPDFNYEVSVREMARELLEYRQISWGLLSVDDAIQKVNELIPKTAGSAK